MNEKSVILVIDDDATSRAALELLLTAEGYRVVFAENGRQGLQRAQTLRPDLILLDIVMPEMDGYEVCQRLREMPELAELPIVMITTLDDRASKLHGLEAGADDFMGKPFDRAELRARVRTITRLNRYRRLLEAKEKLVKLANYDSLTGLANRSLLNQRLEHTLTAARQRSSQFAVMFLDLDDFKQINETLGQECGDEVLRYVARRLTRYVGIRDTVARVGSDEFVILTDTSPSFSEQQLSAEAGELLEAISMPILLNEHDLGITASLGIALFPGDAEDADALLRHAETAMTNSKQHARNSYQFFIPEMNAALRERVYLENQLRKALRENQFEVYYQPQVNLRENRIMGLEALLRWNHPERGLIMPSKFISLAEHTGLIVPLGEWVLRTACLQARLWQQITGSGQLKIAVNVSPRQFYQTNLLKLVEDVLDNSGLAPEFLELEITETLFIEESDEHFTRVMEVLKALRAMGIHLALDDFGTGYSSLNYLKRFPVDTLKIDQAFIQDMLHNENNAALVVAIIAIARSLGLDLIAEGVESEEQRQFLLQQECANAQGHLFSPPLNNQNIETLLHNGLPRFGI